MHPAALRLAVVVATAFPVFALAAAPPPPGATAGVTIDWGAETALPADKAVPPPASLTAPYMAAGLTDAFSRLIKRLGQRTRALAVDDSEFPFLLYGVIDGRCSHHDLRDALATMSGYAYIGSTTLVTREGLTFFALNMTPHDQVPRGQAAVVRQRTLPRLRVLLDASKRLPR